MSRTYKALLRGDRIESIDCPPVLEHLIAVHITLREDETAGPICGHEMAQAVEAAARAAGLSEIMDPIFWQREQRRGKKVPNRLS